jgi:hypothetical protein
MVINDLVFVRITAFPGKADAPLLVDPDAMLAFSVSLHLNDLIIEKCYLEKILSSMDIRKVRDSALPNGSRITGRLSGSCH